MVKKDVVGGNSSALRNLGYSWSYCGTYLPKVQMPRASDCYGDDRALSGINLGQASQPIILLKFLYSSLFK